MTDNEDGRPYFPLIPPRRSSLCSVMKLLHRKRTEITQQIQSIPQQADSFPHFAIRNIQRSPPEHPLPQLVPSRHQLINFSQVIDNGGEQQEGSRVVATHRSGSHPRGNKSVLKGLEGWKKRSLAGGTAGGAPHKMRIKTDFNDLASGHRQRELQISQQQPQGRGISIDRVKQQFIECLVGIPRSILEKNEQNLAQPCAYLQHFNPFFSRNRRIINVCLLKVGRIIVREEEVLFKAGQEVGYFYIILLGRIKLIHGGMRKTCQAGQTVLEEVLYSKGEVRVAGERGKAMGVCVLLEVSLGGMRRLKEELTKNGYKLAYQEIEVMVKRNYIVKNWLRNKAKLQANR